MMKRMMNRATPLFVGLALAAGLGLALSAQAQTCTVQNWDFAQNLVDGSDNATGNVGTQPNGFKRYGGPCGLKVPFGTTVAYVENSTQGGEGTSALNESFYVTRFYVFLGDVTISGGGAIFTAFDSGNSELFSVIYDSDGSELSFNVVGATNPDPVSIAPGSWHSVELVYDVTGGEFIFSVDRPLDENGDQVVDAHATVVTGSFGSNVAVAQLGNIDGVGSGSAYFDDFDSRRSVGPGRLLVGDADGSETYSAVDIATVRAEALGVGIAAGQPDCDENGTITAADVACTRFYVLNN